MALAALFCLSVADVSGDCVLSKLDVSLATWVGLADSVSDGAPATESAWSAGGRGFILISTTGGGIFLRVAS